MTAPLGQRAGDGAMLSRLIGLGRRCGLTPEAVLLHVLDGAPLPEAPAAEKLKAGETRIYTSGGQLLRQAPPQPESLDLIRFARFGNLGEPALEPANPDPAAPAAVARSHGETIVTGTAALAGDDPEPAPSADDDSDVLVFRLPVRNPGLSPAEQERIDQLNEQIAETTATLAELSAALPPEVASDTDASPAPAPLAPDEVATFPATAEADPAELAPPARSAEPLFRAGTKADQALTLWATSDLDYAAIADKIGSTAATVYERIRQGKKSGDPRWQQGFARRNEVPNSQPDAEPANAGGGHEVAQHQEHDAIVGAAGEPLEGVEPVAPENSAAGADEAPMVVDGAGDDCATALRSESSNIPPAGEHGEARRVQSAPDVSPEGAQERPGSRVQIPPGTGVAFEGAPVAQTGRAGHNGDPGSNPGGEASPSRSSAVRAPSHSPEGATEAAGEIPGNPPARDLDDSPAPPPFDPEEKGTVRRDSGSAVRPARPGSGQEKPATLPELADDLVCAVNAGIIVGPRGSLNGFPLINAVLQVLASGDLLDSSVVATRAGVRSGPAVLALLKQWTDDLEKIGVEVIRFGPADVRIKRGRR